MTKKYTLDIIIPAYNCIKTIGRTLDSLVKQTDKNFLVLVIDDYSTEDILSVIMQYKDKLCIKYIRNPENRGCGMSRQRGIEESNADYISFLDSDDILLPNAVEDWMKEIEQTNPEVIYSPFFYIRDENSPISIRYDTLCMCHGKVYNTEFLRKYDIQEAEEVKCIDDVYFNWQVFDLATNVSLLKIPTHIQINTTDSITHTKRFLSQVIPDHGLARKLAIQKILRFKADPMCNYKAIEKKIKILLRQEAENHKKIINKISQEYLNSYFLKGGLD